MSFLEELEKRKANLSMTREELALYAAKRQSLLTGLKGEDVPGISMYTFQDRVPVWIFGGRLQIDFGEISKRLHFC